MIVVNQQMEASAASRSGVAVVSTMPPMDQTMRSAPPRRGSGRSGSGQQIAATSRDLQFVPRRGLPPKCRRAARQPDPAPTAGPRRPTTGCRSDQGWSCGLAHDAQPAPECRWRSGRPPPRCAPVTATKTTHGRVAIDHRPDAKYVRPDRVQPNAQPRDQIAAQAGVVV